MSSECENGIKWNMHLGEGNDVLWKSECANETCIWDWKMIPYEIFHLKFDTFKRQPGPKKKEKSEKPFSFSKPFIALHIIYFALTYE